MMASSAVFKFRLPCTWCHGNRRDITHYPHTRNHKYVRSLWSRWRFNRNSFVNSYLSYFNLLVGVSEDSGAKSLKCWTFREILFIRIWRAYNPGAGSNSSRSRSTKFCLPASVPLVAGLRLAAVAVAITIIIWVLLTLVSVGPIGWSQCRLIKRCVRHALFGLIILPKFILVCVVSAFLIVEHY
jgi:hypothetical protein